MKIIALLLFLTLSTTVFAQDGKLSEDRRREFEAQKVAFFTQQLELTPKEAAAFWPLYNEMNQKIREKERQKRKEQSAEGEKSEEQMKMIVENTLKLEQNMLDIKKEYYSKLMNVVSASKISKLDLTDHKFHKQLFGKLGKQPNSRSK